MHASRVALLVLRNDKLTGWKALGFDATGGRDESVKSLDLAVGRRPVRGGLPEGARNRCSPCRRREETRRSAGPSAGSRPRGRSSSRW